MARVCDRRGNRVNSNVIELSSRRPDPHIAGRATCLDCRLVWAAVAPVGTVHLGCPSCKTVRGVWDAPISTHGRPTWTCRCGCTHMLILLEHGVPETMCVSCGATQVFGDNPRPAA